MQAATTYRYVEKEITGFEPTTHGFLALPDEEK
jgi:hypothetical protein